MLLASILSKSLAVKLALGAAGLLVGGTTAAAETGALPTPVQAAAHNVAGSLGVPAPILSGAPSHGGHPVGVPSPSATSGAPAPRATSRNVSSPTDDPSVEPSDSAEPSRSPGVHKSPEAKHSHEAEHSEPAKSEHETGTGTGTETETPEPAPTHTSSGSGGGSDSGSHSGSGSHEGSDSGDSGND